MRLSVRLAVCLACVTLTARAADAAPILASEAVVGGHAAPAAWDSPFRDRDAHLQWFDDDDWLTLYALEPGKAYLVDWTDRPAFLRPVSESAIAWKRHAPRKPEKDQPAGVPEPATLLLFGLGVTAFARSQRRRAPAVTAS
jgi:hypothetical protein